MFLGLIASKSIRTGQFGELPDRAGLGSVGEAPDRARLSNSTRQRKHVVAFSSPSWADLKEDHMQNPATGLWPIFGPLGPRESWDGPRLEK